MKTLEILDGESESGGRLKTREARRTDVSLGASRGYNTSGISPIVPPAPVFPHTILLSRGKDSL